MPDLPAPTPAIREITARTVLGRSGVRGIDYSLNPYVGCAHGCRYCYADFMRRFSGHAEPWGEFVDVKTNAADCLRRELRRRPPGLVSLSLVTDPYQPAERSYGLTRQCLEVLAEAPAFRVSILTRSPMVLRDLEVLRALPAVEVGLSIGTDRDDIRRIFEPRAPAIGPRLDALRRLREAGLRTYAFVGPILPMHPEELARALAGLVDYLYLDRLNYSWKAAPIYREHRLEWALQPGYQVRVAKAFNEAFASTEVKIYQLF